MRTYMNLFEIARLVSPIIQKNIKWTPTINSANVTRFAATDFEFADNKSVHC